MQKVSVVGLIYHENVNGVVRKVQQGDHLIPKRDLQYELEHNHSPSYKVEYLDSPGRVAGKIRVEDEARAHVFFQNNPNPILVIPEGPEGKRRYDPRGKIIDAILTTADDLMLKQE